MVRQEFKQDGQLNFKKIFFERVRFGVFYELDQNQNSAGCKFFIKRINRSVHTVNPA